MSKSLNEFLTRQGVEDINTLAEGVSMFRIGKFSAVVLEDNKGYVITEYNEASIIHTNRFGLLSGREFLEKVIRTRFDRFAVLDMMLRQQGFERFGAVGKNVMNATFKNMTAKARIDFSNQGDTIACTIWVLEDDGTTKKAPVARMDLPEDKLLAIIKDWEF